MTILLFLANTHAVSADDLRVWNFDVFLGDKPIGTQIFRLTGTEQRHQLTIEARMDVKILFFNAYSYRHRNREVWEDGCLRRIESSTDDNGTAFRVIGELRDGTFTVETAVALRKLSGCVRSFAYWNREYLDSATELLNSQTGEYEAVDLREIGDDWIEWRGQQRPAVRYLLEGPKFAIDLWYSRDGEWLALESASRGDRKLRYVLAN